MALPTGLGSQLSFGSQSSYTATAGTAGTLNHFLPVDKASLKYNQTIVQGGGFQGQLGTIGARRRVTTKGGSGTIETQVFNRRMGLFLQTLMGTTVTPVQQSSTTAYKQTHTFATAVGKQLLIQSAVPSTDGTANPYTFLGCKIPSAEFTFEVDKSMSAKFDINARDVTEATAVPAASYDSTMYQFVGTDSAITIGAVTATNPSTAATGVSKVSVKIERPMKTDRYYLGASGLKAEPLQNDFFKITGTISADFVDKTLWADRWASQAGFSLAITMTGSTIGVSGFNDTFQIVLPCCYLDGDTPTVESADVISGDFPFTVEADTLPFIVVISDETSL